MGCRETPAGEVWDVLDPAQAGQTRCHSREREGGKRVAAGFGFWVGFFPHRMSCEWSCPGFAPADGAPGGWMGSVGPASRVRMRCLSPDVCRGFQPEISAFLRRSRALPGLQRGSEDFSTSYSLPDVSRKWEHENGSGGSGSRAGSSAGSVWGGTGVTPALSRVLNPLDESFGKGQVPVSGLVQE